MDSSTLDRTSVQTGLKLVPPERYGSNLSTAGAERERLRFPAEDGGKSLSEIAQRDLDAALQLLAERAQYITGASGAAIALRRGEEMICRASAGPSAPALGAQLQVNSGLSAESVRTRQILRCDNAELDPRVNRQSCRALGISSVVVLPLIGNEEVDGIFELFSERAYAFGERDITALERLAEMIQTAMEHAEAAEQAERIVGQVAASTENENETDPKPSFEAEGRAKPALGDIKPKSEASDSKILENATEQKPEEIEIGQQNADGPPIVLPTERGKIGSCESCGFPVSEGRKLCLDCESSGASDGANSPFLSSITTPQENWLRSHQYVIATLLVTALTIAVLVWMR